MVHNVMVKVSPKQMSKMRNGHKVRVKPPQMEGEGICLIVHPENYKLLARTFSKGKGAEISLTPEEIVDNKEASESEQMEGKGIFGKKFDRGVRKVIGKKAQQELYKEIASYLPMAQAGLTAGLTAGGTALGALQPELIPFIAPGVVSLSALGSDYLANPTKYQGGKTSTIAKEYAKNQALQQLNSQLGGTNMGNISNATIQQALANQATAEMANMAIKARQEQQASGRGLYAGGSGLYAGAQRRMGGAIGLNGGNVNRLPPALQSQPYSANFQFQATLPPAYQKFSKMGA